MDARIVDSFIDEYHESGVWADTHWRGHRIEKYPTDLLTLQSIIHDLRPDVIIECGTRFGGSAIFLGDMCDLVGHGRVVSIDIDPVYTPQHSRVTYLKGDSGDPNTAQQAAPTGTVLVDLDSNHDKAHVIRELDVWAQHVSVGSYVIVEDTILNGHPIDRQGVPSSWEAIDDWLPRHPEFVRDHSREKFGLTSNPGGYLRRVRT
jgi:cephalosporin hydroxylase